MVISYSRVSKDTQIVQNQIDEIKRYCKLNHLTIDKSIQVEISSRKDTRIRKIDELLEILNKDDILIVTELSRLGRNTGEVINLIDTIIKMNVEIRILKQNLTLTEHDPMKKMMITMLSMFAEFERDIISQRTKESLQGLKDSGVKLGKPTGTIQKSKYDDDKDRIIELLTLGLSYKKVISHLKYGSESSLYTYVKKRELIT